MRRQHDRSCRACGYAGGAPTRVRRVVSIRVTAVSGANRVIRGGSWDNNARNCRSSNRNNDDPGNRNSNVGFRVLSTWR
ncbi:MAG TPA: SUMF1/EgtB/PvdO family nonheme iron enzyme [Candidatus Entotheonella sp.]